MPSRVAIVGLGLMGASLALALRKAWPSVEILGVESDPQTLRQALARGIVTTGAEHLEPARASDLVVLAAPIPALPGLLAGLRGHRGVVTDLASVKSTVMGWAASAGVDLVGGHPLCGREKSGLDAAEAGLFAGAPWALTRADPAVEELVRAVGAHPIVIGAEDHDLLVAGVSHAAFTLSVAYVLALAGSPRWPEMARLAGPGFRDMSRLAAGDPAMYAAIAQANRAPLLAQLDAVLAGLNRIRRHLEEADPRLIEIFEEARSVRERWREEADAGPG